MRSFIEGYDELEKKLGYEPDFHDDHIEKVIITSDRIEFELKTESGVLYKLIFDGAKDIYLKAEILGTVGIIYELDIKQVDGVLKTAIESSLGLYGDIISKRIIVK